MTRWRIDKRLKVDFTWVLSGNLLYSACQWGIVLFLAKLGSPEQVGEYALGIAVSAPIILFANFQLRSLLASDLSDQFAFSQYLTFRLVSLGVALLVTGGVAAGMYGGGHRTGLILLVGFAQVLEAVSDTYYGLMQRYDRMDRISRSLMIKGPLSLAALCGAMYFTRSVVWAVLGLTVGRLVVLLSWDARLDFAEKGGQAKPAIRLRWNSTVMLRLLRLALPLGVISTLSSLSSSVPRYFIEAHRGSAELGIFAAIASLLSAGSLVVSAFGQSIFLPVARACAAADRSAYRGFIVQVVALGSVLGVAAVMAAASLGRDILAHLFRPEYGRHADVFVRLMIAGTVMFIASGMGYVMTAARHLQPQIPLLLVTVIAATVTAAWSIPKHGLGGAADAALAAGLVHLLGSILILLRIDRQLQGSTSASSDRADHAGVQARVTSPSATLPLN